MGVGPGASVYPRAAHTHPHHRGNASVFVVAHSLERDVDHLLFEVPCLNVAVGAGVKVGDALAGGLVVHGETDEAEGVGGRYRGALGGLGRDRNGCVPTENDVYW